VSDPDFIVCDAMPIGMRLVHRSVFTDEPAPGGHVAVDEFDGELTLDDDDEITLV
jgi:hypothetical protein